MEALTACATALQPLLPCTWVMALRIRHLLDRLRSLTLEISSAANASCRDCIPHSCMYPVKQCGGLPHARGPKLWSSRACHQNGSLARPTTGSCVEGSLSSNPLHLGSAFHPSGGSHVLVARCGVHRLLKQALRALDWWERTARCSRRSLLPYGRASTRGRAVQSPY